MDSDRARNFSDDHGGLVHLAAAVRPSGLHLPDRQRGPDQLPGGFPARVGREGKQPIREGSGEKCQGVYSSLDVRTRLTYRCKMHTANVGLKGGWIRLPDLLLASKCTHLVDSLLALHHSTIQSWFASQTK